MSQGLSMLTYVDFWFYQQMHLEKLLSFLKPYSLFFMSDRSMFSVIFVLQVKNIKNTQTIALRILTVFFMYWTVYKKAAGGKGMLDMFRN